MTSRIPNSVVSDGRIRDSTAAPNFGKDHVIDAYMKKKIPLWTSKTNVCFHSIKSVIERSCHRNYRPTSHSLGSPHQESRLPNLQMLLTLILKF